ncbi:MAG: XRE family transcriptional regulator [Actinomyces sp.]|nr:MAG: XRE family transcriptional regulator [Actinomyces sp.]
MTGQEDSAERDHRLDVGAFIRDQRRQAQLSLRKLAERANISNPYLSQIERGLKRPSAEILQQIARALEVSAETLYVRAGILEPDAGGDTDVVSAITADPVLTEDHKSALVRIYRAFVAEAAGEKPT